MNELLYFSAEPFLDALQQGSESNTPTDTVLRVLGGRVDQNSEFEEFRQQRDARIQTQDGFVHEASGVEFVLIRSGDFRMGSNADPYGDEQPVHTVTISQDFLLSKYPVTNAQYGKFMESIGNKIKKPEYWDDRRFNQPDQPVVGVSWHDAIEFLQVDWWSIADRS